LVKFCQVGVWLSDNMSVSIDEVVVHQARLVRRWMTVFMRVNHLIARSVCLWHTYRLCRNGWTSRAVLGP